MSDSFEITYAAHTASCTFLLDSEGICRRIVVVPSSRASKARDAASRCVGAQYVASIDADAPGMLVERPRVGASMLFARVDERGRVSLVRTSVVTRFERQRSEDPFEDKAPSTGITTSAPPITPSSPTPRRQRTSAPPLPPRPEEPKTGPYGTAKADPYEEATVSDRTQPIQALRPSDLRTIQPPPDHAHDEDATLDQTSVYGTGERTTWPSAATPLAPPALPTLRQPPVLPRRTEPYVVKSRNPRTTELDRSPATEKLVPPPPRSETIVGNSSGNAPRTWKVANRSGGER